MSKQRGKTVWGAYDENLEKIIKETVRKLEEIGIPSPTKLEASALIAFRQQNNIQFMNEKDIKNFIMKRRGYSS